ncbi:metallophosphoesterase [Candidatus Woesearchaeota archaeon]|nr:metallophosphoesterase [Candidatus Woesearchaeota archaeon]
MTEAMTQELTGPEHADVHKSTVLFFLERHILLSPDFFREIPEGFDQSEFYRKHLEKPGTPSTSPVVLTADIRRILLEKGALDVHWADLERSRVLFEKNKDEKVYAKFLEYIELQEQAPSPLQQPVKVVFSYADAPKKRSVQDFTLSFTSRYQAMEKILRNRTGLQHLTSINRLRNKQDKEAISFIGMVADKQVTKNGNLMLTVEDQTGSIKALINKNKPGLYKEAQDIVLDEVLGFTGVPHNAAIFVNGLTWPDVPYRELKKCGDDVYALFLSDLHVGSKQFLADDFHKFLRWLHGMAGNDEQRAIAQKIAYIFVLGDLVDGVGIYPGQEKDLAIQDIYQQYEACAALLREIPAHIPLIICPGNHDAVRISEPQPSLDNEFTKPITALPNALLVSNPAMVNIHASAGFPGFDVLIYHGYSFDYYVAHVDSIRNGGGYDRADLIMKFLLKRRHLAPSYTSTLFIPDPEQDHLVIKHVPDFLVTGHIHKSAALTHKNITLLCGSCWQSLTGYQEKVGHVPEPGRVPIINLKTREVRILKF